MELYSQQECNARLSVTPYSIVHQFDISGHWQECRPPTATDLIDGKGGGYLLEGQLGEIDLAAFLADMQ